MSTQREEPKTLGRYRVERRLAQGGMGVVYLGRDPRLDRPVALKTLQVSELVDPERAEGIKERFLAEPRITARLRHANVVPVYDAGVDPATGLAWLALEYVEGGNLADLIEKGIPIKRSMKILDDLASALDHAHEAGIVHRDVKPHNILIDVDGRARLTDFGIAHEADAGRTKPGEMIGAPAYMAPEQVGGGAVTATTDVHALAVVLYEMLTGHRPFEGTKIVTTAQAVLTLEPPSPSRYNHLLPRSLDAVFRRALSKTPTLRHPTARAFCTDVQKALEDLGDEIDEDATTVMGVKGAGEISLSRVLRTVRWAKSRAGVGVVALRERWGDRNLFIALAAAGLLLVVGMVAAAQLGADPEPGEEIAQAVAPSTDLPTGDSSTEQPSGEEAGAELADAPATTAGEINPESQSRSEAEDPERSAQSEPKQASPPKPSPKFEPRSEPEPRSSTKTPPAESASPTPRTSRATGPPPLRPQARPREVGTTRLTLEVQTSWIGVVTVLSEGKELFSARTEELSKSGGMVKEHRIAKLDVPSTGALVFRFNHLKKGKVYEATGEWPLPPGGSAVVAMDIKRWRKDVDLELVSVSE